MTKPVSRQLLSVDELATVAGVSAKTVRRAIDAGLKTYKGGGNRKLVNRAEWDAWRNPGKAERAVERAIINADPDALASMRRRLPELMAMAEADYRAARKSGHASASAVANAARTYATYAEAARKLEKELPEILYRKARYVDAVAIGETLARAGTIVASELDQLGQAIAERCVGQDVRTIRDVIDTAVAKARGAVVVELETLCQPTPTSPA